MGKQPGGDFERFLESIHGMTRRMPMFSEKPVQEMGAGTFLPAETGEAQMLFGMLLEARLYFVHTAKES